MSAIEKNLNQYENAKYNLKQLSREINKRFIDTFFKGDDWRDKVFDKLNLLDLPKYKNNPNELYESLYPEVKDISYDGRERVSFKIRLVSSESDFPKEWAETNWMTLSYLSNPYTPDKSRIKDSIERKKSRLIGWSKELHEIEKEYREKIEKERSDLDALETLLKRYE